MDRIADHRAGPDARSSAVRKLKPCCIRGGKSLRRGRPTEVSGAYTQYVQHDLLASMLRRPPPRRPLQFQPSERSPDSSTHEFDGGQRVKGGGLSNLAPPRFGEKLFQTFGAIEPGARQLRRIQVALVL